ncbi:MAG TPA: PAS domain S-box protein [Pyrinomonadaceae bacterium]|nr:PAS domain S-box protein [Pyrinomonadaceae bacterium]
MSELPIPIRDFILELTEDMRSPAYMLVDDENQLRAWGGDWDAHNVLGLDERLDVSEHVPFLQGLLPLETNNLFLPYMQTREGQYADIYLFHRKEGTWVLLLDATADAAKRQRMQQKANNLSLQVSDLEREGDKLFEAQSILEQKVMERTAELGEANLQLKRELAERKRIEDALRESESRFRRLSDSNMIGILFWDLRGRITEANDAFLEMLGYTREDLEAGRLNWDKVTRAESLQLDEDAFEEMRRTGACTPFKREFIRKDGKPVTLLFGAALLEGTKNKIACFALDLSRYK